MPLILPDVMEYQGRRFLRAGWSKAYVGVVAQYREDKPQDSGHMFIMADGSVIVPHNDLYNPDAGPWQFFMHAVTDNCVGTFKLAGAVIAGFWLGRLKQWSQR